MAYLETTLFAISILIQVGAIVLAIRMIREAADRRPWVMLLAAMAFMLLVRMVTMLLGADFRSISAPFTAPIISAILLISMLLFRKVARAQRQSEQLASLHAAQRDESEGRYRSLVELSPDVMFVHSGGKIVYANSAAVKFFAAGSVDEMIGRSPLDLVSPGSRGVAAERIEKLQKEGGSVPVSEQVWRRLDGSEVYVDAVGTVVPWRGGRAIQSILRDITERKRVEAERAALLASERAARSAAESASRLKDEFLATLSHELRTPLTAILGWAQMLQRRQHTPQEIQQALTIIERAGRSQTRIIEDLLDMSRIISGKLRLDVQRVLPITVVEASLETVRHAAEAKGVRLRQTLDPIAGPVMGDPNRLQQIVWNLLSNAIKFTPKNGSVHVTLARVNSHVEIVVADTGQGIPVEFLPVVFDRFRQVDSSTTRLHGGLGIGLSIVKQLTELHGGRVRAESRGEGRGATFTIELPVAPTVSELADRCHPVVAVESPQLDDAPDLTGVRVLVVEDEPDANELIRRVLDERHAEVRTACCGDDALEIIQHDRPAVLISDIGMPGMDGYEFLRRVREMTESNGTRIPAIALTAFARSEDRTRALLAGYSVHVAKPVEPQELIATVASLAGRTLLR